MREPKWKIGDGKPCTNCGQPAYWLPYVGGEDDDPARAHVNQSGWADRMCDRNALEATMAGDQG